MKEHIQDGTVHNQSHWNTKLVKPIICVDFHHTITKTCEACQPCNVDYVLQDGARETLAKLRREGFKIIIYTGKPDGLGFLPKNYKERVRGFLERYGIPHDEILFTKPPAMFIIDDRAIHHKSWHKTWEEIKRRAELGE